MTPMIPLKAPRWAFVLLWPLNNVFTTPTFLCPSINSSKSWQPIKRWLIFNYNAIFNQNLHKNVFNKEKQEIIDIAINLSKYGLLSAIEIISGNNCVHGHLQLQQFVRWWFKRRYRSLIFIEVMINFHETYLQFSFFRTSVMWSSCNK